MHRVNDFDRMTLERAQLALEALAAERKLLAQTYEDDVESLSQRRRKVLQEAYETLRRAADRADAFFDIHNWEDESEKAAYDRWADRLDVAATNVFCDQLEPGVLTDPSLLAFRPGQNNARD